MSLRSYLYIAQTFSSLAIALTGILFLVPAIRRRLLDDGKLAPTRQQRRTDFSAILLAGSIVCFLGDFLFNIPQWSATLDPAPLFRPIAMLLVVVSLAFALLGRGVGRLTILLVNISIVLWLTTIILVSIYIDDLDPITMV